jgi:hypothetical protein
VEKEAVSSKVFDMGKNIMMDKTPGCVSFNITVDPSKLPRNVCYELFGMYPCADPEEDPTENEVVIRRVAISDVERASCRDENDLVALRTQRLLGGGFDLDRPYQAEWNILLRSFVYTQETDEFMPCGTRRNPSTTFRLDPLPDELPQSQPFGQIVARNNTGRTIQPGEPVYFTLPGPKTKPPQHDAPEPVPTRRAINRRKKS